MGRLDTKGMVGKGLGVVGGVAGGLLGGPVGAMAGAGAGQALGGVVDAYSAQNAATRQRTAGMFGGPRVRPIPAGAMQQKTPQAAAALSNQTPDTTPSETSPMPSPLSMNPARTV